MNKKTGGQFLTEPVGSTRVFSREDFSEEHREINRLIRDFAQNRILPVTREIEEFDKELSVKLLREMGELGFLGIDVPEEYGGMDLDKIASAILVEGLTEAESLSFGTTVNVQTSIGMLGIVWYGTPEQKARYLPKLVTGEWVAAYALTEPSAGSDATASKTTAMLSEDGRHYVLNGEKCFISNGSWADVFTVMAQVDGDKFSAFIVDRDTPGFEVGAEETKMGLRGSSTVSLRFLNVRVPVENLLYRVGKGAAIAFNALNWGRFKLGVACVGGSKRVLEHAIEYALERQQFGQPIAQFDAIKGKIADMTVATYAADSMCYRTTGLVQDAIDSLDRNAEDYYLQMGKAMERYAIEASMAKVYGTDTSALVVDEGLQIFGGYGFLEDYPLARAYRDDRINRIWEGTNEINRIIITTYMIKKIVKGEISLPSEADEMQASAKAPLIEGVLENEAAAIDAAKKFVILVLQEAMREYGKDLSHEQQLTASIADLLILTYTAEATLCRVHQNLDAMGEDRTPVDIARVFCAETVWGFQSLVMRSLHRVFKSGLSVPIRESVAELQEKMNLQTDTIARKRSIAEHMYRHKRYPFEQSRS